MILKLYRSAALTDCSTHKDVYGAEREPASQAKRGNGGLNEK